METISVLHYDYEDPQSLYTVDTKLFDASHHVLQSTASTIANSNPTYTPLENAYPESPLTTSNLQYLGAYSPASYYNYASNAPIYTELPPPPPQHSAIYTHIKEEPEESSSSPLSSVSSHRSSNNSPDSTVSSSSVYATTPECARCTNKEDIIWCNTHFLCKRCLPQMPIAQAPDHPDQSNARKRKRSAGNKNINEICSNCETNHSTLWRRSLAGNPVCNACGLYERLHKYPRPRSMRKDTIQTRKRKSKSDQSPKPKKSQSPKKNPRTSPEATAIQAEYIPNSVQYSLPNYESFQMRNLPSPPLMLPMGNQSPFFNGRPDLYRHDIYNSVPPNDIINVTSVPSSSLSVPSTNMQFAVNCD